MGKTANKQIFEHIKTNIKIKSSRYCTECPHRIYTKDDDTITLGIGNIYSKTCLVIKDYNTNANIKTETSFTILRGIWKELYDSDILQDCYVTRLIKCNSNSNLNLDRSIDNCKYHLYRELVQHNFKKIIFFSSIFDTETLKQAFIANGVKVYNIINLSSVFYNYNNKVVIKNDLSRYLYSI